MQYMALIYTDPALEPAWGTPEFDAMMKGYFDVNDALKAAGHLIAGEGLQGVETATSLRLRGGKVETMDGPFAETKEHLGGYYIMDVPDLETALKYAAMIPSAAFGTIELRPLMDYNPAGK
ncbi:MAG TPA: YciI family protein [Gemmobacter sp.]|nr:YciI family protein [Gemmobacter sp.]